MSLVRAYLRRYWPVYGALLGLYSLTAWLAALLPQRLGGLIDALGQQGISWQRLLHLALIYGGLYWLSKAGENLSGWLTTWLGLRLVRDLRQRLFHQALTLPFERLAFYPVGDRLQRIMSDPDAITAVLVSPVINLLSRLLGLGWALAFAFRLYAPVGWLLSGLLGAVSVTAWATSRENYRLSREIVEALAQARTFLVRRLRAWLPLRLYGLEAQEESAWQALLHRWWQKALVRANLHGLSFAVLHAWIAAGLAGTLILAGRAAWQGHLSAGSVVALFQYVPLVLVPMAYLNLHALQISTAWASLQRMEALLREPSVAIPRQTPCQVGPLQGEVQFQKVSFAYPDGTSVFESFSFHLKAGEHLALFAPSGRGKTTLILLLLGVLQPQNGRILLDGQDLRTLPPCYRRRIGVLWQDDFLIHGSVRENLTLLLEHPPADSALWNVLQRFGLDDLVRGLPQGLDTPLGEWGERLSKGERKRLELARLFLADPDWLILDEPTANLDATNAQNLLHQVRRTFAHRTVLYLTHDERVKAFVHRWLSLPPA